MQNTLKGLLNIVKFLVSPISQHHPYQQDPMNSKTLSNHTASETFSALAPIAEIPQIIKNAEHVILRQFSIFNAKRFVAINLRK